MTAPLLDVEQLLTQEPFVRALARTLVGDEADEVVQQTWLRALGHRGHAVREPRHWLARIARNFAHNLVRNTRRRRLHEQQAAKDELEPSSAELMEREERRRSLVLAVDQLPPPMRTVVLLRYFENLPPREIAHRLGVTVAAVSNRLLRALALLRQRLDAEHGGDRRAWLAPLIPFAAARPDPLSALGATTAGVMLMTTKAKALCAVGMLLLGGVAWWAMVRPSSSPTGSPTASPPLAALNADLADGRPPSQRSDLERRDLVAPIPSPGETTLLVHAVYGDDHSPAADLLLIVGREGEDSRIGPRRLLTDAQGNARFEGLAAGRVVVRSNHLVGARYAEVRSCEVTEIEFVLSGVDITGVVVDQDGAPVPGAEVYLAAAMGSATDAERASTTGADGRFTLRCCTNAPRLVGARALGRAPSKMLSLYGFQEPNKKFDVRIELPGPGGAVEGIVIGPDKSPLADAVVRIGKGRPCMIFAGPNGAPALPAQVRTDHDGHYRAVGLAEGEHPVVVRAAGLAPWTGTCQVAAGVITTLSVTLGAGVNLAGTVHDSDGTPVSQASVTVGDNGDLTYYCTLSATDGSFHMQGLPAEFDLTAAHEKLGKTSIKLRSVAGESLQCDLQLTFGLVLRARLLTESGEVVPDGRVSAWAEAGNGEARWSAGAGVDSEGRLVINNCPDDRLLTIHASGQGIEVLWQKRVDPHAGELLLRAKKMKPLPPPSARIIGTLVLADGKPAAGIEVVANGRGNTLTDDRGHFDFGLIVPGTVRFDVDLDAYPVFRKERDLVANETWDLGTVRLAGGRIVVRFAGKAEGLLLVLADEHRMWGWTAQVDAGSSPFRSRPTLPGRYQLRVSGSEVAAMTVPVEVRENEETVVDMRLQRGV
ncbi:MAG TPA: sigma-70 family RNA polymerase sigma factor, partial [Planctomycetota bacterium]|nr:sigma-70 family RNA polymerase sigma factor [Planctomycetota bacterium]